MAAPGADSIEIDEGLYSRQLYVIGHDAMRRLGATSVLISGMRGLGAEIAKNIVLAGVKSVTIHDLGDVSLNDLSTQFFLREDDIGKNRAETTLPRLAELNSYVKVNAYTGILSEDFLSKFQAPDEFNVILRTTTDEFNVILRNNVVVLTMSSLEDQLRFGDFCHGNDIKFLVANTKGLFGQLFCDFGENFTVIDPSSEAPIHYMVAAISKDEQGMVTLVDDVRHMFDDGDFVTFSEVQGMTELNGCSPKEIKVLGRHTIAIGDTSKYSDYRNGGVVTLVRMPVNIKFKKLSESIVAPGEYVITDYVKMDRNGSLHLAFQALDEFIKCTGTLPKPRCQADVQRFLEICDKINSKLENPVEKLDTDVLSQFASCAAGDVSPLQAVIGGMAAQEVMKAVSGKFTPVQQWLYFDALETLPEDRQILTEEECKPRGSRYDGQIAVFGNEFQKRLADARMFLVGSGAIGCEMLKNWAMMGVGTGETGKVIVTDMDMIEKSNLNRQFLFRPQDIQKMKSTTAAEAVKHMNPEMNIDAHLNRVGTETENIYDDDFFDSLTAATNALDNFEARRYIDKRCVYFCKPLLESGTLGTKCNLQVVIPNLTECYSTARDPPEKSIPMCTLKHFPNAIEHTIQWARDSFEGIFKQSVETAKDYLQNPNFVEETRKLDGSRPMEKLSEVKSILVEMGSKSFDDCVMWARKMFANDVTNQVRQLLYNFPPDSSTPSGAPFWSGTKRCPHVIEFDAANEMHLDYIVAAANLAAWIFGIKQNRNRDEISKMAASIELPEYVPTSKVQIPTNDEEAKAQKEAETFDEEELNAIIESLVKRDNATRDLHPIDFEKDDDSNFHMDFIVAASNLRADNYDIPPADKHKTKLIAGKIIPAIATTTSLIVGLVCIELYKLLQGHRRIPLYKNGFINLAVPFFGFSQPLAAPKRKYNDVEFTLWDRFEINGNLTLKQFIDNFKIEHKLDVTMISYGNSLLYSMLTQNVDERLALTVDKAIEVVTKKALPSYVKSVRLEVSCDDANGEDVEHLPFVKWNLGTRN